MLDQATLLNTVKDYSLALQSENLEPFIQKYQGATDAGLYASNSDDIPDGTSHD
jgi:hypothetical protein